MGFRSAPVVIYRDTTWQVMSYGNGSAYEILRLNSDGDTQFVQDDDASDLRDQIDQITDTGEGEMEMLMHDLLSEYFFLGV
jgi:hypothetical protein